jgi:hypothetical protein
VAVQVELVQDLCQEPLEHLPHSEHYLLLLVEELPIPRAITSVAQLQGLAVAAVAVLQTLHRYTECRAVQGRGTLAAAAVADLEVATLNPDRPVEDVAALTQHHSKPELLERQTAVQVAAVPKVAAVLVLVDQVSALLGIGVKNGALCKN